MVGLKEKIAEAGSFIKKNIKGNPKIAIILGTGLGNFDTCVKKAKRIPYKNIPHFPITTFSEHKGELVVGEIEKKQVICLSGRFHYYEGYSLEQITFPIRVMKYLGVEILIVSNASGGMNKFFQSGDIMLICDHINFMGVNPLIGINDETLGPRFPDMSEPYNRKLIELTEKVAIEQKIPIKKGVYIAVTGPNLETAAEYRLFSAFGADAVGMSTVPEVIVGVQCGLKILGFSIITDIAKPDCLAPVDISEIIKIAQDTEGKMAKLIKGVIKDLEL